MSVSIEIPNSPRSRKAANWEKYGWIYMRISNKQAFTNFGLAGMSLWYSFTSPRQR